MQSLFVKIFLSLSFFICDLSCLAEPAPSSAEPRPKDHFLQFALSDHTPASRSMGHYSYAFSTLSFGYFYQKNSWTLGVNANERLFRRLSDQKVLSLWTLGEEFFYSFRIYEPIFFALGGEFMYISPLLDRTERFEGRHAEVGAGVLFGFRYRIPGKGEVGFFLKRWRGTSSRKFQGLSASLGAMVPLF